MARIFFLFCLIAFGKDIESSSLKLDQVLMLSRHNIRTPLTSNLEKYSPQIWPSFNGSAGYLTAKGALVESYLAEYISEWLASVHFIEGCPKQEDVLVYSNTKPRTRDTAKAFTDAAFRSCNITYHHDKNIDVFDPIFFPIFHNNSEVLKQLRIEEMQSKINNTDLTESYLELNKILDLQNSNICKQESLCDLTQIKNEAVYEEGEEPNVSGALTIGNNIIDTFIMSYYEGFPNENIAWGKITTEHQWELLAKIIQLSQDVRFNLTTGAIDIAQPLLKYMSDIFQNGKPKFTMLVGHDSNLNSVISAMGFKHFELENQYETFPIGGKLVFQKWSDGTTDYLKVEYFYLTFPQLRNAEKLSVQHPPQRVLLELKDCKTDDYGYCPWSDFIKFLDNIVA
ncbi:glucose-1-phosphatase-like [Anticarsia gemmatalis]|uniref:glucose-1-phosphatase-like n=1 Tax=Anticarsia gemmatalis TaxID=129554 RepID=UPI003F76378B